MLLVVTLLAAILGLRSAILSAQRSEQEAARILHLSVLKTQLADVEKTVATVEGQLPSDDPVKQKRNAEFIRNSRANTIPWIKDQITRFSK